MRSLARALLLAVACLGVGAGVGVAIGPRLAEQQAQTKKRAVDRRVLVESPSEQADFLETLGYVDGTLDPNAGRRGVLQHDSERAFQGLNFYYSRTQKQAQLVDMDGQVVYTWAYDTSAPWQHVELDPRDGSIIVLMKDVGVVKLDRSGRRLWSYDARVHHDLSVSEDGHIHVLARRGQSLPELSTRFDVLEDSVLELSSDGKPLSEWSVLGALQDSPYKFLLPDFGRLKGRSKRVDLDVLHTNHIEIFDGRLAHKSSLFSAGNVLVSMRNINTIAILEGQTHEVLWVWGPSNLTFQHHPVLLDDGHILIFNNGTRRSEILELDPLSLRVDWRYGGRADFFSETRGSNQRLPNGNTLITESDTGYVFEVTSGRRIVWEFANPDVSEHGLRGAVWRMTRYRREDLAFLPAVLPKAGG